MKSFDLSQLTEFPQALVYAFEPESSLERLAGSERVITDALIPDSSQYIGTLDAY